MQAVGGRAMTAGVGVDVLTLWRRESSTAGRAGVGECASVSESCRGEVRGGVEARAALLAARIRDEALLYASCVSCQRHCASSCVRAAHV